MNESQRKYMRDYMKRYRRTEEGKKKVKDANERYWEKKQREAESN